VSYTQTVDALFHSGRTKLEDEDSVAMTPEEFEHTVSAWDTAAPALAAHIRELQASVQDAAEQSKEVEPGNAFEDSKEVVQTCRSCGCTNENPCVDAETDRPCYWVATNLCSACAAMAAAYENGPELKERPNMIVAEVSCTYARTDHFDEVEARVKGPMGTIGKRFEHVIAHNAKRGYTLHDWRFTSVPMRQQVGSVGADFHICETIVATFAADPFFGTTMEGTKP